MGNPVLFGTCKFHHTVSDAHRPPVRFSLSRTRRRRWDSCWGLPRCLPFSPRLEVNETRLEKETYSLFFYLECVVRYSKGEAFCESPQRCQGWRSASRTHLQTHVHTHEHTCASMLSGRRRASSCHCSATQQSVFQSRRFPTRHSGRPTRCLRRTWCRVTETSQKKIDELLYHFVCYIAILLRWFL